MYICGITDFMNMEALDMVTPERRKRVLAYRRTEDRARSLVSGLFLRRFCGVREDGDLRYGENGKPYLKNGGPHFNISHSGRYVILAASANEVGADIEEIAPHREETAKRCFQEAEQEWMRGNGGEEAFYYLWTGKESVMKALGLGLRLPPQDFSLLPLDDSAHVILGNIMFLKWFVYDGHVICRADLGAPGGGDLNVVGVEELCGPAENASRKKSLVRIPT